jgi:hypothetical protein
MSIYIAMAPLRASTQPPATYMYAHTSSPRSGLLWGGGCAPNWGVGERGSYEISTPPGHRECVQVAGRSEVCRARGLRHYRPRYTD